MTAGAFGHSYDGFMRSRSRVTSVQFLGLVLIGGSLVVSGGFLFIVFLSKFSGLKLGPLEVVALLVASGICGSIVYFGWWHIKRAFAGRP